MLSYLDVEHILIPVLLPSHVVILDNAKVHYDEEAIAMIAPLLVAVGAVYSVVTT